MRAADLILTNGRLWTEDPAQPEAQAVAVCANRITFVGSHSDVAALAAPHTQIVDLGGRRVVPGFNDAHVHFSTGGFSLTSLNLRGARNEQEFREIVRRFVATRPKGEWILQGEWDPEGWPSGRLPTRELIDDVTPDNPVFINRVDAHTMLANSVAMKLAGVDENTPDIPFGIIERDAQGNPTGIFIDRAKSLIQRVIPPPTERALLSAIEAAAKHAIAYGVTSVQDMGLVDADDEVCARLLRAYQALGKRGGPKIRVSLHIPLRRWQMLAQLGIKARFGNPMLRIGGLKAFSDGSLGSHTAWFFEPYEDAPHTRGMCSDELVDSDGMYDMIRQGDNAGLQLAVHAIGDRANHVVLTLCERLAKDNGVRDRRVRIEHAQHIFPSDFARFARLGVIASVQPYHCIDDGRFVTERVGMSRSETTYAFRSFLDAGVTMAFGSDWWVAPINPLMGIYAAVTRRTLDGGYPDGWMPVQKISVSEAVHAYTMGSAYASFDEDIKGSIAVGKLADMAVLSEDIFHIDPVEIQNVKVDMTILDGQVVYERPIESETLQGVTHVR